MHGLWQVGVTPEGVEVPRSLVDEEIQQKIRGMPKEFQPTTPVGPDPKWRYMWRVGPRPTNTRFQVIFRCMCYQNCVTVMFVHVHLHHNNHSLFFVGTEFWTGCTRRFSRMDGNHGLVGQQNDCCNWGSFLDKLCLWMVNWLCCWGLVLFWV